MGFFFRLGQCSFGLKSKVKILDLSRSVRALPSAFRGAWTQAVTRSFREITTWSLIEKRKIKGQVVWVFLPLPHGGRGRQPPQQWERQPRAQPAGHPPLPMPCTATLRCLLPSNDASKWLGLCWASWFGKLSWKVQTFPTTLVCNQLCLHPCLCPFTEENYQCCSPTLLL